LEGALELEVGAPRADMRWMHARHSQALHSCYAAAREPLNMRAAMWLVAAVLALAASTAGAMEFDLVDRCAPAAPSSQRFQIDTQF